MSSEKGARSSDRSEKGAGSSDRTEKSRNRSDSPVEGRNPSEMTEKGRNLGDRRKEDIRDQGDVNLVCLHTNSECSSVGTLSRDVETQRDKSGVGTPEMSEG